MAYKTIKLEDIKKKYETYLETRAVNVDQLDENYKNLREFCVEKFNAIEEQAQINNYDKHYIDMNFGFELYDYLNKQPDFTSKYESDYDFWRYFAVCVIPDIVATRWNIEKSDHFYSKPTGIYPFQVYWYIKLSWQGSKEATYNVLKDNQEDQILQLVDRPSSIGVNLELYRKIMAKLSTLNPKNRQMPFRAVMMKNTAKLLNIRPELYDGGIDAYVEMLFEF